MPAPVRSSSAALAACRPPHSISHRTPVCWGSVRRTASSCSWTLAPASAKGDPIQVAAGNIDQVSFSPDSATFAVASNDGTASLWDLAARKRLGNPFPPVPGAVPAVEFEPNGRLLIAYLSNAFEWPTNVRTWERFACRAAGRDLTPGEWHDVLPNRAYQPVCHT